MVPLGSMGPNRAGRHRHRDRGQHPALCGRHRASAERTCARIVIVPKPKYTPDAVTGTTAHTRPLTRSAAEPDCVIVDEAQLLAPAASSQEEPPGESGIAEYQNREVVWL
ncbi:hypothetical protein ACFQ0X_06915 [Streptomyces rectiviolaceus]|uniref:Uncharacterized protein n=1 Tax=Streptomyces rectiviolaceus TaxID=332591 RepID=A0ABP6MCA6_9ACTN